MSRRLWAFGALVGLTLTSAQAADSIVVLPQHFRLTNVEARQRLIVEQLQGERAVGEIREDFVLNSSDERVVRIDNGIVIPVADGSATITARHGDQQAVAHLEVTGQGQPFVWSFRNHVESVLSKSGCNGGACHGARAGKNGFRLTLFGFDLEADHTYLTRQANGRRIVPSDPGRSLLLTKPTGMIPHKGGIRFEPDSLEYRVLAEWIAAGSPGPSDNDRVIQRLQVLPKNSQQQAGTRQQLIVLAHFHDGHIEDVTHWAKYTSINTSVASVNDQGDVQIIGSGEGAIKIWYLNYNELAFISVPYAGQVAPDAYPSAARRNFIDEIVLRKLQSLNLQPAPLCDDATFLRRLSLDLIGTLPTAEEAERFLTDTAPDRREQLVESLLARSEFVDYWSYKWSDLLLVSGERLRPNAIDAYYQWIRNQVAKNTPWDQFVRELVTANGSTHEYGPTNFFALHQDPESMAETTAQAFMGLSINCARCHNHPLEKWTNDQYYGFANLFSRVRSKGWGGDFRSGDGLRVVFSDTQGELLQPSKSKPQPPRPLDGDALAFESTTDRRIALAAWLTDPGNPYFSRSIANRVWANFLGVGLVERVDDMRVTNPASNEELLSSLSAYLVEHHFDLKELMRVIVSSATYQRSSQVEPGNQPDERFYSRYYPRRLKAEVLLDAFSAATEVATDFKTAENKPYPKATRAIQLPDSSIDSYFLKTFGRPERLITCDCERSDEPSMTQVLHMLNGETLNVKLQSAENRIARWLNGSTAPESIVKELYLAALSRLPTPPEENNLVASMAGVDNPTERRLILEDVVWSVLSSREFLFNH